MVIAIYIAIVLGWLKITSPSQFIQTCRVHVKKMELNNFFLFCFTQPLLASSAHTLFPQKHEVRRAPGSVNPRNAGGPCGIFEKVVEAC